MDLSGFVMCCTFHVVVLAYIPPLLSERSKLMVGFSICLTQARRRMAAWLDLADGPTLPQTKYLAGLPGEVKGKTPR